MRWVLLKLRDDYHPKSGGSTHLFVRMNVRMYQVGCFIVQPNWKLVVRDQWVGFPLLRESYLKDCKPTSNPLAEWTVNLFHLVLTCVLHSIYQLEQSRCFFLQASSEWRSTLFQQATFVCFVIRLWFFKEVPKSWVTSAPLRFFRACDGEIFFACWLWGYVDN